MPASSSWEHHHRAAGREEGAESGEEGGERGTGEKGFTHDGRGDGSLPSGRGHMGVGEAPDRDAASPAGQDPGEQVQAVQPVVEIPVRLAERHWVVRG